MNENQAQSQQTSIVCPQCGSNNISFQLFQEDAGTTTVSKTKSKYKEKGHGILWWLLIGSWWWIVDLLLWIFALPLKLLSLFTRKKKYKGTSTTVEQTINQVAYKTMCLCGNCGNTWVKSDIMSNSMEKAVAGNIKKLKKTVK